jgi:DUF1680 family protein
VALKRQWQTGDAIDIDLPMTLRTEPLPGNPDTVALLYGPIVLAGQLGKQGITPGSDIVVNERTIGDMMNSKIDVPILQADGAKLLDDIKPVPNSPLTFTVPATGRPDPLTFSPYFRIAHERYSLYWKTPGNRN